MTHGHGQWCGGASGEGEGGKLWKEGEGTSQRTCMNELWTWTTVWELTVVAGGRMGGGGQWGQL